MGVDVGEETNVHPSGTEGKGRPYVTWGYVVTTTVLVWGGGVVVTVVVERLFPATRVWGGGRDLT